MKEYFVHSSMTYESVCVILVHNMNQGFKQNRLILSNF